jgi:hypothetical protein
MKPSCQNITSVIKNLQTLLPRVDLAIQKFEPNEGIKAKEEAWKILKPYIFRGIFEEGTYEYLVKALGSEVELRKRVATIETTGKTGNQLKAELEQLEFDSKKVNIGSYVESMLQNSEFKVTQAGEKIFTLRLQVRMLFCDENVHSYADIMAKADELGLGLLPHEIAADLFFNEKTQPKMNSQYTVASNPITDGDRVPSVFDAARDGDGLCLGYYYALPGWEWDPGREFLFRLGKLEI